MAKSLIEEALDVKKRTREVFTVDFCLRVIDELANRSANAKVANVANGIGVVNGKAKRRDRKLYMRAWMRDWRAGQKKSPASKPG